MHHYVPLMCTREDTLDQTSLGCRTYMQWLYILVILVSGFSILNMTVQHFFIMLAMMKSSNRYIFRVISPLCGESTGHWWFLLPKISDAELWCFLWCEPEQTAEQSNQSIRWWFETTSRSLWRHCNTSGALLPINKPPVVTIFKAYYDLVCSDKVLCQMWTYLRNFLKFKETICLIANMTSFTLALQERFTAFELKISASSVEHSEPGTEPGPRRPRYVMLTYLTDPLSPFY